MRLAPLFACLLLAAPLSAQEKLPLPLAAKFLKIIASADGGSGKVACTHADMIPELSSAGAAVDPGASIAWADTPAELQAFQKQGKIVVASSLELLKAGAPLAIAVEGGKPVVFISGAGRANPRVPGTVKKIAKGV